MSTASRRHDRSVATTPTGSVASLLARKVGSRRLPDSHGCYPPDGAAAIVRLYQRAVVELLGVEVKDPQAGFKAFRVDALAAVLPRMAEPGLAFDTELLALLRADGHTVAEVGVAALHRYHAGHGGAPRDYDAMLGAVRRQAAGHGLTPQRTLVLDRVLRAGSLATAVDEAAAMAAAALVGIGGGRVRPRQ